MTPQKGRYGTRRVRPEAVVSSQSSRVSGCSFQMKTRAASTPSSWQRTAWVMRDPPRSPDMGWRVWAHRAGGVIVLGIVSHNLARGRLERRAARPHARPAELSRAQLQHVHLKRVPRLRAVHEDRLADGIAAVDALRDLVLVLLGDSVGVAPAAGGVRAGCGDGDRGRRAVVGHPAARGAEVLDLLAGCRSRLVMLRAG